MPTPLLQGFPPAIDHDARLLILGSFPSAQSLAVHQYYANPRNTFWQITGDLYGFDATASYERRLAALQSAGVALWDVLCKCRRAGSADSAIDLKSVVVNNFDEFFSKYPAITSVYFNGAKAAQLYRRLVPNADRTRHHQQLPSTSPANAMQPGVKLVAWRKIRAS